MFVEFLWTMLQVMALIAASTLAGIIVYITIIVILLSICKLLELIFDR